MYAVVGRLRLRLFRVRGASMQPTLFDGDLLLVLAGALPGTGRLGIVQLPPEADGTPRPLAVKRVSGRDPEDPQRFWVESDNPRQGTDSWTFGSLGRSDVQGRVLARLRWPLRRGQAGPSRRDGPTAARHPRGG